MSLRANIYFPSPNVQIKLEGDWKRVQRGLDHLAPAVMTGYKRGVSYFSKKLLRIIKQSIANGGPPTGAWVPLSDSTLRTYASHGWNTSGNPYNRTGVFMNSIGVYNYGSRVYVGLPNNLRTENGLTFVQLAKVLEFGTIDSGEGEGNEIPARPLFRPALQAAGGNAAIRKALIKEIRSELIKYGLKPNQVKW